MEEVRLKIIKKTPNSSFIGNHYLGVELDGRIHRNNVVNFKLKKYNNWFFIPMDFVEIIKLKK